MTLVWFAPLVIVNWNVPLVLTKLSDNCGGTLLVTLTVTLVELSAGFGSKVSELAMAELRMVPAAFGCTVSVHCAPAPLVSVPTFQFNPFTEPCVGVVGTNLTSNGRVSETITLLEVEGP